jgi:outer membrane protein assembly factor BamB
MSTRFWLLALLLLSACSGGSGGSSSSFENLDWPAFRRDPFNSGLGGSSIDNNKGEIRFEVALQATDGAATLPVPAIGKKDKIYIGTADGLVVLDRDGNELTRFLFCDLANDPDICDAPAATCIEVGSIDSTPSLTSEGDLIVSATSGYVFAIRDEDVTKTEQTKLNCQWALPPAFPPSSPLQSSPKVIVDTIDQAVTSVFIGTNSGWLQALNGNNGSEKWRFPPDGAPLGPLTSTVALSTSGTLHFTAPNGLLYSLDTTGRFLWSARIGVDLGTSIRLPSPSVNVSVYAVGAAGSIFAYNPDGTRRWQFQTTNRVFGSPAFVNQFVTELIDDKEETRLETIVRVVDENGFMYGIVDRNGREFDAKLCSETTDTACTTNLDCTDDETCDLIRKCTGTDDRCISDEGCGSDQTCDSTEEKLCSGTNRNRSCFDDENCAADETCILIRRCSVTQERCILDIDCPAEETCNSSVRMTTESATLPMTSSPTLSTDLFGVVGSDDGRLCARRLDETVPDDDIWQTGCITIAPGKALSSPVIDLDGNIYVASDEKLYAIGSQ